MQLGAGQLVGLRRVNVELAAGVKDQESALRVLRWLFTETFEQTQTGDASFLDAMDVDEDGGGAVLVVVGPRMAFSTAWSSNAVSICQAAGVSEVTRIERSRRYLLTLEDGAGGGAGAAGTAFAALVHDRMTECVYPEVRALRSTRARRFRARPAHARCPPARRLPRQHVGLALAPLPSPDGRS